jgi:hypothetical protein
LGGGGGGGGNLSSAAPTDAGMIGLDVTESTGLVAAVLSALSLLLDLTLSGPTTCGGALLQNSAKGVTSGRLVRLTAGGRKDNVVVVTGLAAVPVSDVEVASFGLLAESSYRCGEAYGDVPGLELFQSRDWLCPCFRPRGAS